MSKLRPECGTTNRPPTVTGGTAYYCILGAIQDDEGLIHGRLHGQQGLHCAIGSYFTDHPIAVLQTSLIDEVAAVNDAVPSATPKQRKKFVERWLRWKLTVLGFPGFRTTAAPSAE